MLKTCCFKACSIICVENLLKQHVENFSSVTHVESHVKISRCVENVYIRHVENHIENIRKKHHHTLQHVLKLSSRFRFSPSVLHA